MLGEICRGLWRDLGKRVRHLRYGYGVSTDHQDSVARYAPDQNMLKKKNDKKYQATQRTASNIPRREKDTPQKSKAVGSPLDQQKPPYCRTRLNTSNKQERITRLRSDPGRIGRQQRNLSGHPPHARPPSRTAQNRAKPRPSGQALAFRPGDAPSNQERDGHVVRPESSASWSATLPGNPG